MYLDELRNEQRQSILAGIRRWEAVIDILAAALGRVRRVFTVGPADKRTAFHVHRVPGTDTLR